MSFWGSNFTFDDTPCSAFDLMIYDVGSDAQGATQFASTVTVMEEYLPARWKPLFIGGKLDKKLEFQIVFGVNEDRIDTGDFLSRVEMDRVANWLTGHKEYKYLEINQPDMPYVRYKCIITGLQTVEYGMVPWAFKATVTCDGPYAYRKPFVYTYNINGSSTIKFNNQSTPQCLHYKPKIIWETTGGGDLQIVNQSDNGRAFVFSGIPYSVTNVTVDNENCLITNNMDLNLYRCFNYNFFRLKPGGNVLDVIGTGTLKIVCEFPVNVGG